MRTQKAYLVESIPRGMDDLRKTKGVEYTEKVLKRLTDRAEKTIDLTAMYWNLLPQVDGSDESGFTEKQFDEFGAKYGQALYSALRQAADRGVRIRIIQSRGFEDPVTKKIPDDESHQLAGDFPKQVQIRQIDMEDWYGAGIMHQKIWIFDQKSIYIGSANMDWKSISQVKELGVVTEDASRIAEDVSKYFEVWWPLLFDALLQAVTTKGIQARLLISKWAHTSAFIHPYLIALDQAAKAARMNSNMIAGRLEIRRFIIPGWDSTLGHSRNFPGHSRVNHTKYIVTDRRINIGTSNMTWDYFTNTAGCSFNSDHPDLLQKLQEIFDRDWDSQYADSLENA